MDVDDAIPAIPDIPAPQAGQANSICPVATGLVYSIPPVPGATSYTWNFPAGWTITSGQGTTMVTVTAGVQSPGTKNITVTATNTCGSETSDPLEVTVGTFPFVNAGPDQIVCAGTTEIQLDGTIGGATGNNDWTWSAPFGEFLPNNKRLNGTYDFSGTSIITGGSVTITMSAEAEGACPDVSDEMILSVRPYPTATTAVSGADPICEGSSSTILFTATPNTIVTYNVNGGTNQTIAIDATGTATLNSGILTFTSTYSLVSVAYDDDPACSQTATGSATVTVNPLATVDAGPDQTICEGSTVSLTGTLGGGASTGSWNGGAGTFTPNAPVATYTPGAADITAGSVTLTLTTNDPAGPCDAVSDEIVITINPLPVVDAGEDQTVCADDPLLALAGVIQPPPIRLVPLKLQLGP
jgi:hypothetical protein